MTSTVLLPDVDTILNDTGDRPPQKCHTIDKRGFALCGAFGPRVNKRGEAKRHRDLHTRQQCRARGHRHCAECDELNRQLGDDHLMAA